MKEGEKKKNRNLPDFAKYNLIYGWNGSGKSTISEAFRDVSGKEKFDAPMDGEDSVRALSDKEKFDIVVGVEEKSIPLKQFKETNQVRVFNTNNVRRYVKNIESTEAGVLEVVIGEKNVEKQNEIEKNEALMKEKDSLIVQGQAASKKKNNKKDEVAQNAARDIKNNIRDAKLSESGGFDYKRPNYERDVEKFDVKKLEFVESTLSEMDEEKKNLQSQLETLNSSSVKGIDQILPLPENPVQILTNALEVLSLDFTNEAIQNLKENKKAADWVEEGIGLHNISEQRNPDEPPLESCYFCDSPISSERINLLQKHFTASYRDSKSKLQDAIDKVKGAGDSIVEMEGKIPLVVKQIHENLQDQWKQASAKVLNDLQTYKDELSKVEEYLSEKKEDLTRPAPQNDPPAIVIDLDPLNILVGDHNQRSNKLGGEKATIEKKLSRIIIDRRIIATYSEYKGLESELLDLKKVIENHENEKAKLEQKNVDLKSKMSSKGNSVDELNVQIERCFFLEGFKFKRDEGESSTSEKNGIYKLERSSGKVGALSEGERAVISLLYFLLTLSDSGAPLNKTIVVIDDPINNMDYLVKSIVQEEIIKCVEKCRQLFMFMHDYTFFQDFKNRMLTSFGNEYQEFYFLEKNGSGSFFLTMPEIFLKHSSEYHYLFYKVYNARARKVVSTPSDKVVPTFSDKEVEYCTGNIARKCLEEFLDFRMPKIKKIEKVTKGKLKGKLLVKDENSLYARLKMAWEESDNQNGDDLDLSLLLGFVHGGSHGDQGFKYLHNTPEICRQAMLFIKVTGAYHYENMIKSLEFSDSEESTTDEPDASPDEGASAPPNEGESASQKQGASASPNKDEAAPEEPDESASPNKDAPAPEKPDASASPNKDESALPNKGAPAPQNQDTLGF